MKKSIKKFPKGVHSFNAKLYSSQNYIKNADLFVVDCFLISLQKKQKNEKTFYSLNSFLFKFYFCSK